MSDIVKVTAIMGDLSYIVCDALTRLQKAALNLRTAVIAGIVVVPSVLAAPTPDYTELSGDHPSYVGFVAQPVNGSTADVERVLADEQNFGDSGLQWAAWTNRAHQIRHSGSAAFCVGNLSVALSNVGGAYQAGASGATTLLTLLPTIGALLGAPATELWVLAKLFPLGGVLSMCLSLGGNLVPNKVDEYEHIDSLMSLHRAHPRARRVSRDHEEQANHGKSKREETEEDKRLRGFVQEVDERADVIDGTVNAQLLYTLTALQLIWLGCIVVACWILQQGSVIVWLCTYYPWVFTWYAAVAVASFLENATSVPFSQQWTMRVSRAPKVEISADAPWLVSHPNKMAMGSDSLQGSHENLHAELARNMTSEGFTDIELQDIRFPHKDAAQSGYEPIATYSREHKSILQRLREGCNIRGNIVLSQHAALSERRETFYVIISVRGIRPWHTALQFCSRFLSIGVFTLGTALFASSSLVTILMATIVACLMIVAAIFGRICALSMARTVMEYKPIIHRVVATEARAEEYIEEMLKLPNLLCEIKGHLVLNGRCIRRYKPYLRWHTVFGILSAPFSMRRLAGRS